MESSLEWDILDRNKRLKDGELTEETDDPTVVVVSEDE